MNLNGSEEPPRYSNLQQSASEQEGDENVENILPDPSAATAVGGDVIEVDSAEPENVDQTADQDCCSCQVYSHTSAFILQFSLEGRTVKCIAEYSP